MTNTGVITSCHVGFEDMEPSPRPLLERSLGRDSLGPYTWIAIGVSCTLFGLDMRGMSWHCVALRADLCTTLQFGLNICILSLAPVLATE